VTVVAPRGPRGGARRVQWPRERVGAGVCRGGADGGWRPLERLLRRGGDAAGTIRCTGGAWAAVIARKEGNSAMVPMASAAEQHRRARRKGGDPL
jgi:hypothetical protein